MSELLFWLYSVAIYGIGLLIGFAWAKNVFKGRERK